MSLETEPSLEPTTADLGADTATQASAPEATAAADVGTDQVNPADATPDAQPTTNTRSSPEELLQRATNAIADKAPTIQQPQTPAPVVPALPPELQELLKNPAEVQRLTNLNQLYGRQAAELGQLRQQVQSYQGLPPPQQLREQITRQQQQAEAEKLKPWHPRHPDAPRTHSRLGKAQAFIGALEAATPEQQNDPNYRANLAQRLGGVRREDLDLLEQHKAYKQELDDEFHQDPDAFVTSRADRRIEERLAQYEQYIQQKMSAQQFLETNQPLLAKHSDAVSWAMNNPARREVGIRLAQLEEENRQLRERSAAEAEVVETAKARDHVTKQRATVRRDAVTAEPNISDVITNLREKNATPAEKLKAIMKARNWE